MSSLAKPGTVYLVGAGPGDPDLITVRGLALLRQADVVLYDRLVHPDLLAAVRPGAERIYVGKAPGRHACPQGCINDLLVEQGRQGWIVVRLKGGDPFVFGRGGEEAQALAEAGVPFEVVPGLTSAVSVPAYAGIPVTHRGLSNTFTVVTGHTCDSSEDALDWPTLARAGTLVILMGLGRLPEIARHLIDAGQAPETAVAVIAQGSTAEQQVVDGTLADIGEKAAGLHTPATIVVGEVVGLRQQLDWFRPEPSAPEQPSVNALSDLIFSIRQNEQETSSFPWRERHELATDERTRINRVRGNPSEKNHPYPGPLPSRERERRPVVMPKLTITEDQNSL